MLPHSLDLRLRRVVGWSSDSQLDRSRALDALGMAQGTGRPEPDLATRIVAPICSTAATPRNRTLRQADRPGRQAC